MYFGERSSCYGCQINCVVSFVQNIGSSGFPSPKNCVLVYSLCTSTNPYTGGRGGYLMRKHFCKNNEKSVFPDPLCLLEIVTVFLKKCLILVFESNLRKHNKFLFSSPKNCSWSCKEHFLIGFIRPLLSCLAPADQLQYATKRSFFPCCCIFFL